MAGFLVISLWMGSSFAQVNLDPKQNKELKEDELWLNDSEEFYKEKSLDVEELGSLLEEATIANLTGNFVVKKAIDLGYVNGEQIVEILGVKHAQLVKI